MLAYTVALRGGVDCADRPAMHKGCEKGCALSAEVVQNFAERRVLVLKSVQDARS
jgi:hypothetical protein